MIRAATNTRTAPIRLRQRASFLTLIMRFDTTYRQRRALAELDAHQLADIGLTKAEALTEASKPFWLA